MLLLLVIVHDRVIVFSVVSGYQTESNDQTTDGSIFGKGDGKYLVRTFQYVNTDPQTGRFRSSGG